MPRPLMPALLAALLLTGCSGRSCDELPALTAERDAARETYTDLVAPGTAPPEVTAEADEALHELDRQVFDLEESCG